MTLVAKLQAVMAALDTVAKRGLNERQNYAYVKAVDVAREAREALLAHGVGFTLSVDTVAHQPMSETSKMLLTTAQGVATFYDVEDAKQSGISVGWAGTGFDSGDKGLYKAITGGLKYVLRMNFLIPDEEDPEVGRSDEGNDGAAGALALVGMSQPKAAEPEGPKMMSDVQKRHLRATAREHGLEDAQFKLFLFGEIGKTSSKDVTAREYAKLIAFLEDKDNAEKLAEYAAATPVEA